MEGVDEELEYLRFFHERAGWAFGPVHEDICYKAIQDSYERLSKLKVPPYYDRRKGE